MDFLLDIGGDLHITAQADIEVTPSVRQAVIIRLRWFLGEWRFGQGLGFPYLEEVFVKNPNLPKIRTLLHEYLRDTPGVTGLQDLKLRYDPAARTLKVTYTLLVGGDTFQEEVDILARIRTDP